MRNAMHIGPSAGSRDRRQALVLAVTGRIVRPNPAKPLHDSCAARLTPRTHKRGRRDGGKRSQSGAASRPGASTAKATSTHEGPRQGGRPASSTGACRDGPARGRAHTVRPPPPSLEGPYATKDTVSGAAARLYSRTRLKTRQATTRAHGTAAIAPICHSAASPRSPERQWRKPRRRMRARGEMAGPPQALVLAATGPPGGRSTPAPPLSLATSGSTGASRSWSHLETKTPTHPLGRPTAPKAPPPSVMVEASQCEQCRGRTRVGCGRCGRRRQGKASGDRPREGQDGHGRLRRRKRRLWDCLTLARLHQQPLRQGADPSLSGHAEAEATREPIQLIPPSPPEAGPWEPRPSMPGFLLSRLRPTQHCGHPVPRYTPDQLIERAHA